MRSTLFNIIKSEYTKIKDTDILLIEYMSLCKMNLVDMEMEMIFLY